MKEKEIILSLRKLTTKLEIEGKAYKVVEDLSFDLPKGKTLALVGESGCGKTMAALSILRILPTPPALFPTGEIIYKDKNLLALSENEMRVIRGGKIGMIFQNPSQALNPVYTVASQMEEVAGLHLGLYGSTGLIKAAETLFEVGFSNPQEILKAYPHQLSGGMKQRVMIAMALLGEPDILIADEPTTALDVTIQAQVLELMRKIQKERNMAILLITHDMGVVSEMADEVVVMYAALGIEKGSISEVFDHMAHPYTRGLFASLPQLDTKRGKLNAIKGSVPPITHFPQGCRFHPRCPYVMPKCCFEPIPDFRIESENHTTKCVLYDGTEESLKVLR